jgi:hypothetical protein
MVVEWERILGGLAEDFRALDSDEIVGRVSQYGQGLQSGFWFWTTTAVRRGPRVAFPTNGMEARRGDAGRRVVKAYEKLLARTKRRNL